MPGPRGSSRAVRRPIASPRDRHVRYRLVPDRVSSRLCHSDDRTSLRCRRSGEPKARRLPCPGPTWRCSRRRHRRFTNMYSFPWPWRFIVARSAARLSAIVGPPIKCRHISRLLAPTPVVPPRQTHLDRRSLESHCGKTVDPLRPVEQEEDDEILYLFSTAHYP